MEELYTCTSVSASSFFQSSRLSLLFQVMVYEQNQKFLYFLPLRRANLPLILIVSSIPLSRFRVTIEPRRRRMARTWRVDGESLRLLRPDLLSGSKSSSIGALVGFWVLHEWHLSPPCWLQGKPEIYGCRESDVEDNEVLRCVAAESLYVPFPCS